GNAGTTSFTFTVSLSAASGQTVSVVAQTADGTATVANNDYTARPATTLTFAPGVTSQPFTVQVTGDTAPEPNDTFLVNLGTPTTRHSRLPRGPGHDRARRHRRPRVPHRRQPGRGQPRHHKLPLRGQPERGQRPDGHRGRADRQRPNRQRRARHGGHRLHGG